MYTPGSFELTDLHIQHQLIEDYPFGTLTVHGSTGLAATHLPFLLTEPQRGLGTLQAHVARSNTEFGLLADATPVLVIFQGPHAYISPSWYPSKKSLGGKAVPTWNYVSVHVHGMLSTTTSPEWLLTHLEHQTNRFEKGRADPWKISDAPADYINTMLNNIVGLEISITSVEAKQKLSQNRPMLDQQGVIHGLLQHSDSPTSSHFNEDIARLMRSNLER
ncbi:FMN-binding negative transcriptional regulator [Candidimonas sp. SYP-B2681]|uniref:FMN-binding negative transcriptional regulator n=1 Tax=Candidimonas sp. SYP-B2681 TaxID=2497686 RepID=UPI000F87B328|nr:FMN-binding negative transcriptional regulator [Candidimonas sp. SYP-B2681]RTZ43418.1 FMN-binding negative transcriptional regulator [Candidimonas sp. SYP-B2681]